MALKIKGDFERYIQQQLDLGYDKIYLPLSSRSVAQAKIKALPIKRFSESKTLEQLEKTIADCQNCSLHKEANKLVFGIGDPNADIMFVGEAPGADEDIQGKPFVGRAGKLLDKMLVDVGVSRDEVYITNVAKHRPPGNRDPLPDEVEACEPYLHLQIKFIQPKIICALGRIAGQTLLKTKLNLGDMRKQWFDYQGIKLMVTYHPAAILRSMSYLEPTMEDLRKLVSEIEKMREQG
jgi:uracil-DNA glycosylase family 4